MLLSAASFTSPQRSNLMAISPKLLEEVRKNIQPVMDAISELPKGERAETFKQAMEVLEFPGAFDDLERLTKEEMAKGVDGKTAFRNAMVYVVARGIAFATQQVLKAKETKTVEGIYGLGVIYGPEYAGVSGVWSKIKKGFKAVGRGVGKVVKAVGKVTSFVGCGAASVTKNSITEAACSAGKVMDKAGGALNKASTDKKKKKKKAEPKAEPKAEAKAPKLAAANTGNLKYFDVAKQKATLVKSLDTLKKSENKGLSTGAKVGIAVAVVALVGGGVYVMQTQKKD